MKKYPIVLIEWIDASGNGRWRDVAVALEEAKKPPAVCYAVGFLVHRDKTSLTIAAGTSGTAHIVASGKGCVADTTKIPIRNVRFVKYLKRQW